MAALSSRSSISSPSSLTNRLLDPYAYQELRGLTPEVEADPVSGTDASLLSPKAKAEQAYQAFCKSAKDFYVVCAGPNRIDLAKPVDIKRNSDTIKAQYPRAIAKKPKDLSDDEKAVIKQKAAYDKVVEAFAESQKAIQAFADFQKKTDENTRREVIQSVDAQFQQMSTHLSPTTMKKERSLEVVTVKLNEITAKLELQAGEVFSQFLSFGNRALTVEEERTRISSLEEIARTYNCFYHRTSEVEVIKNPPKRLSALMRALESFKQFANTPQEKGVFS